MSEPQVEQREVGFRSKLAVTLVCLVLALAGGVLTALFVKFSEDTPSANFAVPSPQMVLLTDQPNATVTYSVDYYQGSVTSPGETQLAPSDSTAPVNTREMKFQIHVAPGVQHLRFALLLNQDASMTEATSVQGLGFLDNTVPGGTKQSSCPSILSFNTAQVLSGVTDVDSTGDTTIDIVGGVPDYVRYPSNGDRTPVNVLQMLPTTGETAAHARSATCTANLINWEQVGGIGWQTPIYGSGQITIGSVPAGQFIESSNPPTTDAQTLSWNLQGPADVSYTLFNSDSQSNHEIWLFWAGIAAALGVTLFVEFVKEGVETLSLWSHRGSENAGPEKSADPPVQSPQNRVIGAKKRPTQWPAFVAGLLSGVLVGRNRRS